MDETQRKVAQKLTTLSGSVWRRTVKDTLFGDWADSSEGTELRVSKVLVELRGDAVRVVLEGENFEWRDDGQGDYQEQSRGELSLEVGFTFRPQDYDGLPTSDEEWEGVLGDWLTDARWGLHAAHGWRDLVGEDLVKGIKIVRRVLPCDAAPIPA